MLLVTLHEFWAEVVATDPDSYPKFYRESLEYSDAIGAAATLMVPIDTYEHRHVRYSRFSCAHLERELPSPLARMVADGPARFGSGNADD